DTDLTPVDLGSYSSRVTLMTGNAAIQAAERARDVIALHAGRKLDAPLERVTFAAGRVFDVQDPERGLTFAEAVQLAEAAEGTIGTVGSYTPAPSAGKYRGAGVGPSPAYSYSACVAEVDVDPATGIVRVPKIWIAHDVGRVINAATVMGQIEGSVYMGLGEALMEEMAYRGNRNVVHKIPSLLEYKSPSTLMLRLPSFTYLQPKVLQEALAMKADAGPDGMYVAGGTDLYPNMKRRHQEPRTVISLMGIPELAGCEMRDARCVVGSCMTLTDLSASPPVRRSAPAVAHAAELVSTPLLRN